VCPGAHSFPTLTNKHSFLQSENVFVNELFCSSTLPYRKALALHLVCFETFNQPTDTHTHTHTLPHTHFHTHTGPNTHSHVFMHTHTKNTFLSHGGLSKCSHTRFVGVQAFPKLTPIQRILSARTHKRKIDKERERNMYKIRES
jgi:hypothetical protein